MISFATVRRKSMPKKSAIDIAFGYGRHGSNVRHYIPKPEEIKAICAAIRDLGYTDQAGVWHGPWNDSEHRDRAGIRFPRRVEVSEWEGVMGLE